MKVLITGGAGFIGSHIAEYFSDNTEVTVIDNLRTGNYKNIENLDVNFVEGDIQNRHLVKKLIKNTDYVFHLAAIVSVPESIQKPLECVDINAKGTLILLEEASKAGVKKLCFSSTCAVYGDDPGFPKLETMNPCPQSPYAVTKLDGEYYCKLFSENGWLDTVCLRYFNVFGPRQDPDSAYAAAIPIFTSRAVKDENLIIYGDGAQTRDFVYVKDVVRANVWLSKSKISGIINIGYGRQSSVNEIAKKIIKLTESDSRIIYKDERPGDIKYSFASIDKLLSTGYKHKGDFETGLAETVKYFVDVENRVNS
ncbi:MAG: NAD-dependent epimerase/dehydratase family protein [Victivallales bacterium]|nr:NAD-dependent epimerase/dehydratase family protein [Victivallales bacterium]